MRPSNFNCFLEVVCVIRNLVDCIFLYILTYKKWRCLYIHYRQLQISGQLSAESKIGLSLRIWYKSQMEICSYYFCYMLSFKPFKSVGTLTIGLRLTMHIIYFFQIKCEIGVISISLL